MILLKREYVYNKPVVVKGSDGLETHKTYKLKTPHNETHIICAPALRRPPSAARPPAPALTPRAWQAPTAAPPSPRARTTRPR